MILESPIWMENMFALPARQASSSLMVKPIRFYKRISFTASEVGIAMWSIPTVVITVFLQV